MSSSILRTNVVYDPSTRFFNEKNACLANALQFYYAVVFDELPSSDQVFELISSLRDRDSSQTMSVLLESEDDHGLCVQPGVVVFLKNRSGPLKIYTRRSNNDPPTHYTTICLPGPEAENPILLCDLSAKHWMVLATPEHVARFESLLAEATRADRALAHRLRQEEVDGALAQELIAEELIAEELIAEELIAEELIAEERLRREIAELAEEELIAQELIVEERLRREEADLALARELQRRWIV